MLMKKLLYILSVLLLVVSVSAQTVVRMRMPHQSEKKLEVVTLFAEGLPLGIPVVLGTIGFDISGGEEPLTFEWLKDNVVVATGDIAVITPVAGSQYMLRVSDRAGCYFEESIRLDATAKIRGNELDQMIIVAPTVISNEITVQVNSYFPINARVRVFSTGGEMYLDQVISGNYQQYINWEEGVYFVVITAGDQHQVTKVIVKK